MFCLHLNTTLNQVKSPESRLNLNYDETCKITIAGHFRLKFEIHHQVSENNEIFIIWDLFGKKIGDLR